jgi:hypothetical protein
MSVIKLVPNGRSLPPFLLPSSPGGEKNQSKERVCQGGDFTHLSFRIHISFVLYELYGSILKPYYGFLKPVPHINTENSLRPRTLTDCPIKQAVVPGICRTACCAEFKIPRMCQ